MTFMVPEYLETDWFVVDGDCGTEWVPCGVCGNITRKLTSGKVHKKGAAFSELASLVSDFIESSEIYSVTWHKRKIGARLSASGYMDCTDWAVFGDECEARAYIRERYEVDPDTGDELDDDAE